MAEITAEMSNVRVMLQGQSNCWGVGPVSEIPHLDDKTLSDLIKKRFERVFIMLDDSRGALEGTYEQLEIGTNNSAVGGCIGCEFGLAVRWTRETTQGNLYIDKQYIDGAPIRSFLKDGKCNTQSPGCPGP